MIGVISNPPDIVRDRKLVTGVGSLDGGKRPCSGPRKGKLVDPQESVEEGVEDHISLFKGVPAADIGDSTLRTMPLRAGARGVVTVRHVDIGTLTGVVTWTGFFALTYNPGVNGNVSD